MTKKKSLMLVLQVAMVAAIIYFVSESIHVDMQQISSYFAKINPWFYSSLIIFTAFLTMQAWIWVQILNYPAPYLSSSKGIKIYINSQFAKYLPGGFWNYVGRVYMTSQEGVPMRHQMKTILYENLFLVLAAACYSMILVYKLHLLTLPVIILIVAGALLALYFYDAFTNLLEKGIKKFAKKYEDIRITLPRKQFVLFLGYFLISHFIMGIAYWMLIQSFGQDEIGLFYAAGTFALAWLVGLISPLPGGIGVREGILVFLLQSNGVDTVTAVQISIITRIWNVMSEVLFFAIMNGMELIKKGWRHT